MDGDELELAQLCVDGEGGTLCNVHCARECVLVLDAFSRCIDLMAWP